MEKIKLEKESETLVIPLYSKALLSREGILLKDEMAQRIVEQVDYDFKKAHVARLNDLYMGVRAAALDQYAEDFLSTCPDAIVLHLGCGLDGRCLRVKAPCHGWYDLDFSNVIACRRRFYPETETYRMIAADVTDPNWLEMLDGVYRPVLVVMEGLTMYLGEQALQALVVNICNRFPSGAIAFDAYSLRSVKISQKRNPVNAMGATIRWGLDDPSLVSAFSPRLNHEKTLYFSQCPQVKTLKGLSGLYFKLMRLMKSFDRLYQIHLFNFS